MGKRKWRRFTCPACKRSIIANGQIGGLVCECEANLKELTMERDIVADTRVTSGSSVSDGTTAVALRDAESDTMVQ